MSTSEPPLERRTWCGNHNYRGPLCLFLLCAKAKMCVQFVPLILLQEDLQIATEKIVNSNHVRRETKTIYRSKGQPLAILPRIVKGYFQSIPQRPSIINYQQQVTQSISVQCQILTQITRTMPRTSTWAGWDTLCFDSVLVYFRSILNFLSRTEGKVVHVLSYLLPPNFMLKVFFIPSDRWLLILQSGSGLTLSRSARCQTQTADNADNTSYFKVGWIGIELTIQNYFRTSLAEIAWSLVTIMNEYQEWDQAMRLWLWEHCWWKSSREKE